MSAERPTVADVLAEGLAQSGVGLAWGMPGGDSLPLVRAMADRGIRFVLVRDEASAGFAADATAQLTGGLGVCLATLGPGLTNLASGVVGCTLDRAPVLAFTSRYRTDRRNLYTHMMMAQEKVLEASGKAWFRLGAAHVGAELRKAVAVATAARPGAVWVEVPGEVATADTDDRVWPVHPAPAAVPAPSSLRERVGGWRRPVILAGFAARHADVAALAEALRAPVLTTYKAKGCVPEGQGWSAGPAGLSPVADRVHQELVARADGLLLLGWDPAELRDHWLPGWPEVSGPEVVVVDEAHVTDLPATIHGAFVGDPAHALDTWLDGVDGPRPEPGSAWTVDEVEAHRARHDAIFAEAVFGPASAIRAVQQATGAVPEVVTTLDVGAHRITASHVLRCARPDALLQSNGWSSMGYGLPAAIAAAALGHPAVAIIGDMGLQLVAGELGTAVEVGGTVVVVVLLDDSLSLIELKQQRLGHPSRGVGFANPSLPRLAEAFGGTGVVVADAEGARQAVADALGRGGLSLVGVRIDPAPYREQM